ncbi:helix-turn-helix domain-containing protein [Providencia thailandensis]|nr:helix-turn-helix domain-containing protein [Providencia thailandensis]MCL8323702.1 helix-turn-helix domain-containing protein [Providencia thailandensis]
MTLIEYINTHYNGSQKDFASKLDIKPQQVTQWINKDFIVINHVLYSPRRDLSNEKR